MMKNFWNRKAMLTLVMLIPTIIVVWMGCKTVYFGLNGDPKKIAKTEERLKEKMEAKYNIHIVKSEGDYSNKDGYGASFTTDKGISFGASKRKNRIIDTYMEEVWRKKGIEKWGYASKHLTNVEKIDLNVGYRDGEIKEVNQLKNKIGDVKNQLWLTLYVDLKENYKKNQATEIENGILHYYQALQKDQAEGVELIVRLKNDTGSYMITRDEKGELPKISDVRGISSTFNN
ncbi:hypothetical protein ACFCYN_14220 [Gottfriedia sp. NPDC056225]|uniref:hypothetical protein n=1 Tax=Gottfriedia sp. NPDC056225 TaxID=3345751 RepID=UPI0035D729FE